MSRRENGSIVGSKIIPSANSGVWGLTDAQIYTGASTWPRGTVPFTFGNQSATTLYTLGSGISAANSATAISAGGTLTINSLALGSYDAVVVDSATISSGWTAANWFTTTADTRSAIVICRGNMTIDAGQIFTPTVRKLFTYIFVGGNLTINGEISMSSRGANHSATTAQNIKIHSGTFSSVVDPQIPSAGGAAQTASLGGPDGRAGNAGTSGGTGGGGQGADGDQVGAASAGGTSFSGGSGSGGHGNSVTYSGVAATGNGGAGGTGQSNGDSSGGGAGNPGGGGGSPSGSAGSSGTGGVLVIICLGTLSGSGAITASGATGGAGGFPGGGGSGGGSVTVMCKTNSSSITPTASGGAGGGASRSGGGGGAGTARILIIP